MRQSYVTCPTCTGSGRVLASDAVPPRASIVDRIAGWVADLRAEAGRAYASGADDLAHRYREAADRLADLTIPKEP